MFEAALLVAVAGTATLGLWSLGRRWGVRRVETWAGTDGSPYRAGVVHHAQVHRATWVVYAAVATNVLWALATGLLFAPAGIFLVFMSAATALPVAALLVSGEALAVGLIYASWQVLRRPRGAAARAETVARWSIFHHVGVAVLIPLTFIANDTSAALTDGLGAGALAGVLPAAIGVALAALLLAATRHVHLADREEATL